MQSLIHAVMVLQNCLKVVPPGALEFQQALTPNLTAGCYYLLTRLNAAKMNPTTSKPMTKRPIEEVTQPGSESKTGRLSLPNQQSNLPG